MARRELNSYRWDGTRWSIVTKASPPESQSMSTINQTSSLAESNEPIRIATLNILADCFPWFIEMAIRSSERLEWLCDGIKNLNPTILGLNEVTMNALQRLQESSFIREHYFITTVLNDSNESDVSTDDASATKPRFPHECVILSKLALIEAFAMSVSGRKRQAIIVKTRLGRTDETSVYICAHHATPYKSMESAELRAQQMRDIVKMLEQLHRPFIIMGDLNLYHQHEDATVIENKLIDAWAQTHFSAVHPFNDNEIGYTFDSSKNSLIPYYIPGSCRRMRLDRILFSHGFPAFAIQPCRIWANEPIKADDYLFPSDHFGLFIDLAWSNMQDQQHPTEMTRMPLSRSDPSAEKILRRNAENENDQQLDRLGIVRRARAYTSHIAWLGARTLGLK